MSMALHSEEEAIINGGNKMNKAKCMKLHSHPGMEVKLGVPTDHVIIDSDIYHHILNIQPSFAEPKPKPRDIEHDRAICERMVKEDNCWDLDCEDCPLYDKGQLPGEDFSCKKLDGFIAPAKKWLAAHPKPKPPEVLTVRIVKSKLCTFWYSDNIGDLFEVTPRKGYPARYKVSPYDGGNIRQEDAEIIYEYDHSKYRLMGREEKVEAGDEANCGEGWGKLSNYLDYSRRQSGEFIYIRPLKPAIPPVEAGLTKCEDRLTELERRLDAV